MNEKSYHDIPGTYIFDGAHVRKGYNLNMFCKSLDIAENRAKFKENESEYLNQFTLTPEQRHAVLNREFLELLRLGGNIYYTFKLAILDGLTMQDAGALMSGNGMSVDDFRQMMVQGGRNPKGNRSKKNPNL